jgi:hypothetical protein
MILFLQKAAADYADRQQSLAGAWVTLQYRWLRRCGCWQSRLFVDVAGQGEPQTGEIPVLEQSLQY